MQFELTDFNGFGRVAPLPLVREIEVALEGLLLPVKASDQAGKQGRLIFDPVGANEAIKTALAGQGWSQRPRIPREWSAFGVDVDFDKQGVLVEVQFSNYPFLSNNVMRANLFFAERVALPEVGAVKCAVVVTKAKLFEASNSTLYYEQAVRQIQLLLTSASIHLPLRVLGLMAERGAIAPAVFTSYHTSRQSRTVLQQRRVEVLVGGGGAPREVERLELQPTDQL